MCINSDLISHFCSVFTIPHFHLGVYLFYYFRKGALPVVANTSSIFVFLSQEMF